MQEQKGNWNEGKNNFALPNLLGDNAGKNKKEGLEISALPS